MRVRIPCGSLLVSLACLLFVGRLASQATTTNELKARIEASPKLPFHGVPFVAQPPAAGWVSGMVSGVDIAHDGTVYELQRGDKANPIVILDLSGGVLRSWGKGDYTMPHSIHVDPQGNVWTVDAGSSIVTKYTQDGLKLMTIQVGERPDDGNPFAGATDIAFGPKGGMFISDGYGNARVLEYDRRGRKVHEWGHAGFGPGEFHLPHSLQVGADGTVYVADRENGRIQEFDLDGKFLREIDDLGRVYSIRLDGAYLWASTQALDEPPGSGGWILKMDRRTGKLLGHIDVPQRGGLHGLALTPTGEPVITLANELLWFHAN